MMYISCEYKNRKKGNLVTIKNARTSRLNMRIAPETLETLRAAAASLHQDVSSFVLGTAVEKAREVLKDESVMYVSQKDWGFIQDLLTNENAVPQGLIDLFARTDTPFAALSQASPGRSKKSPATLDVSD